MADINATPGLDLTSKSLEIGVTDGALGSPQPVTTSQIVGISNGAAPTAFSQHHVTEGDTVVIAVNGEKHSFVHVKSGLCASKPLNHHPPLSWCIELFIPTALELNHTNICHSTSLL